MKKSHRDVIVFISLLTGAIMILAVLTITLLSMFTFSTQESITPELIFIMVAIAIILIFVGVTMLLYGIIKKKGK